jgi:hypothetical protein
MARRVSKGNAHVGVSDHCGWAVLITVDGAGNLLDRRRVELIEAGLPWLPHHSEGQRLPIDEAVALVDRVTRSANACARACLEALAATVPAKISTIALRASPTLPATVAERISSYYAQTRADGVMYRDALARAAEARGWSVHFYDARKVLSEAASALGLRSLDDLLQKTGAALGPPWQKDHRVAMAAAIAQRRGR